MFYHDDKLLLEAGTEELAYIERPEHLPVPNYFPQEDENSEYSYSFFATGVDGFESPEGRWTKGPSIDGRGEFSVFKSEPIGDQELGLGAVGHSAVLSAFIMGSGRVLAVDRVESCLEVDRAQGAEVINFEEEDPVQTIFDLTGGIGVDRVIEAVGVDAEHAHSGPAAPSEEQKEQYEQEIGQVAPQTNPQGELWQPGSAPSQSVEWATQAVAKGGSIGVIGVLPPQAMTFPIGALQQRNLTVRGGNCNHRRYIPKLVGIVDPTNFITDKEPVPSAVDAYEIFDQREPGWLKVELDPAQ